MVKRRISSKNAKDIAEKRISELFKMSKDAVRDMKTDRASRYVSLAMRIGQKTCTSMPEGEVFCKKCRMPLIVGDNCRVRTGNGRVKVTCLNCGDVRRIPYAGEKKE